MSLRPSYFELVAADRLTNSLKTAVSFVLRVYSENRESVRLLLRFEDEVLLALSALLETGSVFQHAASFSEALYGLARRSVATQPPKRLTAIQLSMSLASILGVPYVQSRLMKLYQDLTAHENSLRAIFPTPPDESLTLRNFAMRCFLNGYPYGRFCTEIVTWCYQFLYLVGRSDYYSPWLHLMNLQIFSISPDELRKEEKMRILKRLMALRNIQDRVSNEWLRSLLVNALKSYHFLTDNLRTALICAIFIFKALEWWYLVGEERLKERRKLPIPPPPPPPVPHPDGIELPTNRPDLCPLCMSVRTNPTQLTASGYVFCYACIFDYVSLRSSCPVTLVPAHLNQLRRLYKGSTTI